MSAMAAPPTPLTPTIQNSSDGAHRVQDEVERPSDMRKYWPDTERFRWNDGSETEKAYPFNVLPPWLYMKNIIKGPFGQSKSSDCNVSKARADPKHICFKYNFVVKELMRAKEGATKEVDVMRQLQHPHIVALLGSLTYRERLHILIYPAAVCDLEDLMISISDDALKQAGKPAPTRKIDFERIKGTLLEESLERRIGYLKCAFFCLCQALAYLHRCNVRHKDIKARNIVVDSQGYVLLTDFGTSEQFEKDDPHMTTKETSKTKRYQSPEKYHGKPRGDPDDIWSLGCVFLEMISIVLGCDWMQLHTYFEVVKNIDGRESIICAELEKIDTWINQQLQPKLGSLPLDQRETFEKAIGTIRKMLEGDPAKRPKADSLRDKFMFFGQEQCVDCYPGQKFELKQTDDQAKAAENVGDQLEAIQNSSTNHRRLSSGPLSRVSSNSSRGPGRAVSPSSSRRPHSYSSQSPTRRSMPTHPNRHGPRSVDLEQGRRSSLPKHGMSYLSKLGDCEAIAHEETEQGLLTPDKPIISKIPTQRPAVYPEENLVDTNSHTNGSALKPSQINNTQPPISEKTPQIMINGDPSYDKEETKTTKPALQLKDDNVSLSTESESPLANHLSTMAKHTSENNLDDTILNGSVDPVIASKLTQSPPNMASSLAHKRNQSSKSVAFANEDPQHNDAIKHAPASSSAVANLKPLPTMKEDSPEPDPEDLHGNYEAISELGLKNVTQDFRNCELKSVPDPILQFSIKTQKFSTVDLDTAHGHKDEEYQVYEMPKGDLGRHDIWFFNSPYSITFAHMGFLRKLYYQSWKPMPYIVVWKPGRPNVPK